MAKWLDFSGAPPLLIPQRLVRGWHGTYDACTNEWADLNEEEPGTDYDRACVAAWPGRGIIGVSDGSALALYTEFDAHSWSEEARIVLCGGWSPSSLELAEAEWTDRFTWEVADGKLLLMNSAANGSLGLRDDDFMEVILEPGTYAVEYASLERSRDGCFHRFTRIG